MNLVTFTAFVGLAAQGLAQSTPPTQAASPGSTFYGAGITGMAQTSPKVSGFFVVATELSKSAQIWSFSESDAILVAGKIQTSTRTGFATPLRKVSTATVYALADGGVATNGTAAGGAYAGGAIVSIPLPRGFFVFPGFRYIHSAVGGTQVTIGFGIGKGSN